MWVVNAPFDGEVSGEVGFSKAKLLKTGKTYGLGRKGCPLIVNNKKISSNMGEFMVGEFTEADVLDPSTRPRLEFINKKDKPLKLHRNEVVYDMQPNSPHELQDGDNIMLLSNVWVRIEWKEVCCFITTTRGTNPVPLGACASLGIHITYETSPQSTHHLCSTLSPTPLFAASLLSLCEFAKLDWLVEVIRLGEASLEEQFSLPSPSKYLPGFSESVPESQRSERVWQPNEERHSMLSAYRFLCVDEKGRELDGDFKDMVEKGAGSFETFDPHSGRPKFRKALARGQAKEGKTQIIVGKPLSIQAAVGKDAAEELLQEAQSYELGFTPPEQVVRAVIEIDASRLIAEMTPALPQDSETLSGGRGESTSSPRAASTSIEQAQEESQPRRKLVRRAASRQPSVEPSPAAETALGIDMLTSTDDAEPPARPRRALTRRGNAGIPVVIGLDDPSSIIDAVPDLGPPRQKTPPPAPPITDLTVPTPSRPKKLKRRAAGGVPEAAASQALWGIEETPVESEPPLKKFKALFDASGQDSFNESAFDEVQTGNYSSNSQTQSQTQGSAAQNGMARRARNLSVLREEEEEESQISTTNAVSKKRPLQDIDENTYSADDAPTSAQQSKRRAIENVNAVDRHEQNANAEAQGHTTNTVGVATKPPSKGRKTGAEPGKPDQDHAFLQALASTKKGKKKEDEFDRDFNNLKISKPNLEDQRNPADDWKLLADFGEDTNIRGNFMTIVELPAFNRSALSSRRQTPDPTWDGLPNFKKFKKKSAPASAPVELFAPEANDYGIGPAYWESGPGNGRSQQASSENLAKPTSQQSRRAMSKTPAPAAFSDSEEDVGKMKKKAVRASSRAASTIPEKRITGRSRKPVSAKPLFIPSDDDDDIGDDDLMDVDDDDTATLATNTVTKSRSHASNTRAAGRGKKPVITVDDDSDDGVFKGFGSKSRGR